MISSIICSMVVTTTDEVGQVKSARLASPDDMAGVRAMIPSARLVLPLAVKHLLYRSHESEKSG